MQAGWTREVEQASRIRTRFDIDETERKRVMLISVIIPALNEAERLPALLECLAEEAVATELIVADGGSEDGTAEIASSLGAKVLKAPRGRGQQLAAGCALARGDAMLQLHADTDFPRGGLVALRDALASNPKIVGGNFRILFDGGTEFDEWLNGFYAWFRGHGIYYGDSGIFTRRQGLSSHWRCSSNRSDGGFGLLAPVGAGGQDSVHLRAAARFLVAPVYRAQAVAYRLRLDRDARALLFGRPARTAGATLQLFPQIGEAILARPRRATAQRSANLSNIRTQLRAPFRKLKRLYFSLGEWMASSSSAKPSISDFMPSSR